MEEARANRHTRQWLRWKRLAFLAYYVVVSSPMWCPPFFNSLNKPRVIMDMPAIFFWGMVVSLLIALGLAVQCFVDERLGDLMSALATTLVFLYLLWMVLIGLRSRRRASESQEQFLTAGRSFGTILIAFTWLASWFVGAVYTGFFADAATLGPYVIYCCVYSSLTLVVFYYVSPRIWVWGKKYHMATQPDLIYVRYRSKALMVFVSLMGIAINVPWVILGLKTYHRDVRRERQEDPLQHRHAVAGRGRRCHVALGGVRALVLTDFVQACFKILLVTVGSIIGIYLLFGNPSTLIHTLQKAAPSHMSSVLPGVTFMSVTLAGTFGGLCWPPVYARLFAADSVRTLRRVVLFAPILGIIMLVTMFYFGLGGATIKSVLTDPSGGLLVMSRLAGGTILFSLFAIDILAGEMSNTAACYSAFGGIISKNLVEPFAPTMSEKSKVLLNRICILALAGVAYLIATQNLGRMVPIIMHIYDGIIQFLPFIVFGVWWRRGTKWGAWAGMLAGMIIVVTFSVEGWTIRGVTGGIIGLIVNVFLYVVIGLLSPKDAWVDEAFASLEEERSRLAELPSGRIVPVPAPALTSAEVDAGSSV